MRMKLTLVFWGYQCQRYTNCSSEELATSTCHTWQRRQNENWKTEKLKTHKKSKKDESWNVNAKILFMLQFKQQTHRKTQKERMNSLWISAAILEKNTHTYKGSKKKLVMEGREMKMPPCPCRSFSTSIEIVFCPTTRTEWTFTCNSFSLSLHATILSSSYDGEGRLKSKESRET